MARKHLLRGVGRRGLLQAHQRSGKRPHDFLLAMPTSEQLLMQLRNAHLYRIIEAGTYLNGTRHVFPDWGNATVLNTKACYENVDVACVVPGGIDEQSLRMTAMRLNDTGMLYTRSYVDGDQVWIAYVEEPFVE